MSKVLLDMDILSEILKGKSVVMTARAGAYLAQQRCFTVRSARYDLHIDNWRTT
jgi:hypothetical protein